MYTPVPTRSPAAACQTGAVFRDGIVRWWRAGLAWLRQSTGRTPRLTPWGWAADAILAVTLSIGVVNAVSQHANPDVTPTFDRPFPPLPPEAPVDRPLILHGDEMSWWQVVLAALVALPLATRRRFPLASFWIIALAAARVFHLTLVDLTWPVVASVIAAYSAPAYSRYRNVALVSVVLAAFLVIAGNRADLPNLPSGLLIFLLLSSVGLAANAIHTWRQRAEAMRREQAAATQLALDHERARLARELHDVVGHNVSLMVVQAGAARKVLDTAPHLAREALLAVEAGGRSAMTELRQVIGLLTVDSDGTDLAPQPGLDQLPVLAARIRETGVPVTLTMTGTFSSLPAGVELAAYRVVQEALTNAVKHAAGAAVTITVTGTPEELRVEVTDTGGSGSTVDSDSGRGLAGLRDRLSAYGGTLTAGRRPTGGFRVVAVTPLRTEP
jgi:signal transduction histidine kinase